MSLMNESTDGVTVQVKVCNNANQAPNFQNSSNHTTTTRLGPMSTSTAIYSSTPSYLSQGLGGPRAEPIDDASVEQGGRGGTAAGEAVARRVHGEHHVKASLNLRNRSIGESVNKAEVNTLSSMSEQRWVKRDRVGWRNNGRHGIN